MQAPGGPPGGDPGAFGGPGPPPPMPGYDDMGPGGNFGALPPPGPPGGGFGGDPYGSTGGPPPPAMMDSGVSGGPANGGIDDIGPFMRPIFNKLVRVLSALTSLVALILHFMVLGQGITSYMKPSNSAKTSARKAESAEETAENEDETTTTTSRRRSSTTSRSRTSSTRTRSSTTLLGRGLRADTQQFSTAKPTPTARLMNRGLLQGRQNNPTRSSITASPTPNYVPDSDVPLRDGAVGFTASSHLFAAFVILLLFWLEWMLFMRKPTMFSYWGPLIIAIIQLYMAFDILGRSLNVANQAGGYVLLLMAVINVFLGGWTVLHAKKARAAPLMQSMGPAVATGPGPSMAGGFDDPYGGDPFGADPAAPPPMPMDGGPHDPGMADLNDPMMGGNPAMEFGPEAGGGDMPPPVDQGEVPQDGLHGGTSSSGSSSPRTPKKRRGRRRRASTGTSYRTDDVDSYYGDSPSYRDRRHSYSYGQNYPPPGQTYGMPPLQQAPPANDYGPTTPISLYGPQEYRRRLENQRRARRRTLTQPAMQYDPNTGQYIEPAQNFNARSMQPLSHVQEEEEEEYVQQMQQRPGDPNLRQDGFANRTRVWKRLHNDSGLIM